jgi:hypothetical protein
MAAVAITRRHNARPTAAEDVQGICGIYSKIYKGAVKDLAD